VSYRRPGVAVSTARARLAALLDGTRPPGVYRWTSTAHPAAMRRELSGAGWGCHLMEGRTVTDRERFFDACATSLAVPAWFGRNFETLFVCLTDLSWLPGQGHVLLWRQYGVFAEHDPQSWTKARDVFADAVAERVKRHSPPLYVLLRGHGPTEGLAAL